MPQEDPVISAWFAVEFQGKVQGAFRECTGLGSENEVVESKQSNGSFVLQKLPGNMKFNNITLKRGITSAMDMWKWRKMVEQGQIDQARVNGSIIMYNHTGSEIARWNLLRAWPSKLTGPAPNASNNEVGIEELEIVHEGYERVN
jgi:phage tail-like protein